MNHTLAHQRYNDASDIFGFWIYILSDCILFGSIFAAFIVLNSNSFGTVSVKQSVDMTYVFAETLALLTSSLTFGLAMLAFYRRHHRGVLTWLMMTFVLGSAFIGLELNEFIHLYAEGFTWERHASLSAFFTLVGTHGLHVAIGLLWMLVMMVQFVQLGTTNVMYKRLTYLGLFWAFLDIVWIFVYTVVYLLGAI